MFTMTEAVRSGEADDLLVSLNLTIADRLCALRDSTMSPPRTEDMQLRGQVWVWIQGDTRPHWEVRATGVAL